MESHLVSAQVREIKSGLARFITAQSNSEPERVLFSRPVLFMSGDNPDMVFSVYGIDRGVLLFDTPFYGVESLDINTVPVEAVIRIKEQMEYHYKNKQYTRD